MTMVETRNLRAIVLSDNFALRAVSRFERERENFSLNNKIAIDIRAAICNKQHVDYLATRTLYI